MVKVQQQHLADLKTSIRQAEDRGYQEEKRQAELRADEKSKAFSVTVRPYIKRLKDDGFFKKMKRLEVGYGITSKSTESPALTRMW